MNENVDEAAKLIGEYGIVAENVAKVAVPKCNIVCITGEEMKTKLSGYLNVLFAQNPAAVGGQLRTTASTIPMRNNPKRRLPRGCVSILAAAFWLLVWQLGAMGAGNRRYCWYLLFPCLKDGLS